MANRTQILNTALMRARAQDINIALQDTPAAQAVEEVRRQIQFLVLLEQLVVQVVQLGRM